eukprot:CAMPEP_0174338656 /NCGR_PEP_ID=MMETSP0810-20121108/23314_1 /TAXON_ID=73025 ORGANISM="Eutreptiella gymnastica-like, Strain CCMP1594" /NCGR_SAMPLE_ID=MMETSP0810 /ASSEMBLY_ACC=CAM_ASM_000659 /LENGTH=46 /DNA_ID= /DNA_START= /DNA_END= /DNA_ORIENTATION=
MIKGAKDDRHEGTKHNPNLNGHQHSGLVGHKWGAGPSLFRITQTYA